MKIGMSSKLQSWHQKGCVDPISGLIVLPGSVSYSVLTVIRVDCCTHRGCGLLNAQAFHYLTGRCN